MSFSFPASHGRFFSSFHSSLPALSLSLFFCAAGYGLRRSLSQNQGRQRKKTGQRRGRRRRRGCFEFAVWQLLQLSLIFAFAPPSLFGSNSPWPRRRSAPETASCSRQFRRLGRTRWRRCRGRRRSRRREPRLSCSVATGGLEEEAASSCVCCAREGLVRVD